MAYYKSNEVSLHQCFAMVLQWLCIYYVVL